MMTGKVRPDVHLQDWRSNFTKVPWKMSEVNLFILPYIEAENDSDEERDENDSDSSGYEGWSSGMLRLAKRFLCNAILCPSISFQASGLVMITFEEQLNADPFFIPDILLTFLVCLCSLFEVLRLPFQGSTWSMNVQLNLSLNCIFKVKSNHSMIFILKIKLLS